MIDKDPQDSKTKLESLESDLYNPLHTPLKQARKTLSYDEPQVRHAWREAEGKSSVGEDLTHTHSKLFRNLFLGALIFCVGAFAFMMISLVRGRSSVSNDNIILATDAPPFVDGGQTVPYKISITNKNTVPLEFVDLVLEYETGSPAQEETLPDTERHRIAIGTILPRQEIIEEYPFALYGQEGEERSIFATLEYRIPGSNSIFTKSIDTKIAIQSSPIKLTLSAPDTAVAGQPVEFIITSTSAADFALEQNALKMVYPRGFKFVSSSFEPIDGSTHMWNIGALGTDAEFKLTIQGVLEGDLGTKTTLYAYVGSLDPDKTNDLKSVYATTSHTIEISTPFIATTLGINGSTEDQVILKEGDPIRVSISLRNTTANRIQDVRVSMNLDNPLLRSETLEIEGGRYNTNTKSITWTQDTSSDLARIDPGNSVTVGFSIRVVPLVDTTTGAVIRSPRIPLSVSIRGTGSEGNVYEAESIDSIAALITTSVVVEGETLYASGPFPNTGTLPPSVGKTTTYTIHWRVRNVANALSDTRITTKLPAGVTWLGQISPSTEKMTYNTESKTLVWTIGQVPAGTGYTNTGKDVFFQVAYNPSLGDVGQAPDLTGEVVLTGQDTFTNQTVTARRRTHTTALVGDTTESDGRITP